jgi:hypothetical protein
MISLMTGLNRQSGGTNVDPEKQIAMCRVIPFVDYVAGALYALCVGS